MYALAQNGNDNYRRETIRKLRRKKFYSLVNRKWTNEEVESRVARGIINPSYRTEYYN